MPLAVRVKYDGFRALCHIERGRCRLISRNGKPLDRFVRSVPSLPLCSPSTRRCSTAK
jgi:hypothetical protein